MTSFFGVSDQVKAGHPVMFGVPSSLGSPRTQCRNGPYFLRRLTRRFTWSCDEPVLVDLRRGAASLRGVADIGDIQPGEEMASLCSELREVVAGLPAGSAPIAVGGDHSITLPIVSALQARSERPITVVCFDHHLDHQYWAKEADPLYHTNVMTYVSEVIGKGRLVQIGVEPVQTVSTELADWYLSRLEEWGTQFALLSPELEDDEAIINAIGQDRDVYISLDVDVLPRHEMGATAYPADIGLSLARIVSLLRLIGKYNRVVGADLVEFAAEKDDRTPGTLSDAARASILLYELLCAAKKQT